MDKKDKIGYTGHEKDKKEVKRRRQGEGRERVAESRHQSAWGRRGAGKSKRMRDKEGRKEPDRRHSGMTSVGGKVRGGGGEAAERGGEEALIRQRRQAPLEIPVLHPSQTLHPIRPRTVRPGESGPEVATWAVPHAEAGLEII